jgi:large subunit ribosomal protein L4
MASIEVVDQNNKAVGAVEVSEGVFGSQPHGALVHSAVVMQLASLRQGTASTKGRSEVSGSGKKTVEAKTYGTGSSRFESFAGVASWRDGFWASTPKV